MAKQPSAGLQCSARGGPANHRRQRAGNRADGRVPPGDAFERRVNEDIQKRGEQREKCGEQIDAPREQRGSAEHEDDAICERDGRIDDARRNRASARAVHLRVDVAFEIVVQHGGAGGGKCGADEREENLRKIMKPARGEKITDERGDENHEHDAWFCEFDPRSERRFFFFVRHGLVPNPKFQMPN